MGLGPRRAAVLVLAGAMLAFPGRLHAQPAEDPDALYAARADLSRARRAAELWAARLVSDDADVEAAWKLSRAAYWLGGHAPTDEQRDQYERGIDAGERAVELARDRPEGHFWMAANMGAVAETFGRRAGLRYVASIKEALETVLGIDPAFQLGSADRALGRWYAQVPRLLGGSRDRAIEHLRRSLTYDPTSSASHFFLAEIFLAADRPDEARPALEAVLAAPLDDEWAPETLEFQHRARELLSGME